MKKNEQLFDIMGDLPEDYIEDAMNDNVVTEKRISAKRIFRTIAAAAAVFTAVCAVPAAVVIMNMNHRVGNDPNILPASTEVSSETTEVTDVQPENTENSDQNEEENRLSFGTGPERPENYTPDRKYSCCRLNLDTIDEPADVVSNALKTILVDESYADEIISDYESEIEKYVESLGLNSDEYRVSYNLYSDYTLDADCSTAMNGYIEIYACFYNYRTYEDKMFFFTYDLVEKKRIDNYSDLFYYGEDYISKIGKEMFGKEYSIDDSPELFFSLGYLEIYKADGDPDYRTLEQEGYDISVIGRYRDLKGVIKDEYLAEREYDEWYEYCTQIQVYDYTVGVLFFDSRYHSESEINMVNSKRRDRCSIVFDYLIKHHYFDDYTGKKFDIGFYSDDSEVEVYGQEQYECFTNGLKYDTEKEVVIPADSDIPEWRDYVKGYLPSIDDYEHLNTDINFDIQNCECLSYRWANWYFVAEDSHVPTNDYFVTLTSEELENLNDVALFVECYNRELQKKMQMIVVMPFEKINNASYNKDDFNSYGEPYTECVRYWDK